MEAILNQQQIMMQQNITLIALLTNAGASLQNSVLAQMDLASETLYDQQRIRAEKIPASARFHKFRYKEIEDFVSWYNEASSIIFLEEWAGIYEKEHHCLVPTTSPNNRHKSKHLFKSFRLAFIVEPNKTKEQFLTDLQGISIDFFHKAMVTFHQKWLKSLHIVKKMEFMEYFRHLDMLVTA